MTTKMTAAVLLGFAASMVGSTTHAAPVVVTSLTDYDNAVGPSITKVDEFDGTTSDANTLVTDMGIVSTVSNGDLTLPSQWYNHPDFDFSEFGFFLDRNGNVGPRVVTWTFPEPVLGFYGEWVSVTEADVTIVGGHGTVYDISEAIDPNPGVNPVDGFWGLVDPAGIEQVQFSVDPDFGSSAGIFWLTSMGISTPIPEPSALGVILPAGLAGLAGSRRRPFGL